MTSSPENKALRVLVAPDSFKGSLDASAVAASIAAGVREAIPGCVVVEAPIADGGGRKDAPADGPQLGGDGGNFRTPKAGPALKGKDGKILFIDKEVKVDTAGADIAAKLAELGVARKK